MDELELIRKAGAGDDSAFEALVRAYEKTVYNLCLRITGDREEAFDLSQETFIKAWHAISLFQFDSKFVTWLCRIASNTCIDYLRKQKRRKSFSLTLTDHEDTTYQADIADSELDPAVVVEKSMDREAVEEAFSSLAPEDRLILSMRGVNELTYQEIGQALNLKPGTVKSRIARARERLRIKISGNQTDISSSVSVKGGGN